MAAVLLVRANTSLRRILRNCNYPWRILVSRAGRLPGLKLRDCQQLRNLHHVFPQLLRIEANRQWVSQLSLANVCRRECHSQCVQLDPANVQKECDFPTCAVQTALSSAESVDAVLCIFEQNRKNVQGIQLAAILDKLLFVASKSSFKADLLSNARSGKSGKFLDYVIQAAPKFTADEAVSCLCSCGKHGFRDTRLLSALCCTIVKKFHSIPTERLESVFRALRELNLPIQFKSISKVAAKPVFTGLMDRDVPTALSPTTVTSLVSYSTASNIWREAYSDSLQSYVSTRLSEFKPQDLSLLLLAVTKQGVGKDFLLSMGEAVSNNIALMMDSDLIRICWAYGKALVYHSAFFEALQERIITVDEAFLSPRLLATAAWACSRVRFYSPRLMDRIAAVSLATLGKFNYSQNLSMLAYAFGALNHPHMELLSAVSEKVSSDRNLFSNSRACHNIAWACMVVELYPKKLLERIFSSTTCTFDREVTWSLLQLHTAVTVERPELGIHGLNETQKKERVIAALSKTPSDYNYCRTLFERNVHNALRKITGGFVYISSQAFTSVGYTLDAEILLSPNNKPISIPRWWRYRKIDSVQKALMGITQSNSQATNSDDFNSFLSNLKSVETSQNETICNGSSTSEAAGTDSASVYRLLTDMKSEQYKYYITLASDWVDLTESPSLPVHATRRVAVEIDGPMHFAVNCSHLTGSTALKRRQLTALGWEVISVPYYEWEPLETDGKHADYLARRIFR